MRWSSMILVALLLGCSTPGPVEPVAAGSAWNLPLIHGPGYSGIIFPQERAGDVANSLGIQVSSYWTPDAEVITRLESVLRSALESGFKSPEAIVHLSDENPDQRGYEIREIGKILDHLPKYRRQYVGIVVPNGTRRVLVNCFLTAEGDPLDFESAWRQHLVLVEDGGFWFWRIQYDVNSDQFSDFESNGYA